MIFGFHESGGKFNSLKIVRFVKNAQFLLKSLEGLFTAIGVGTISHSLARSLSLLGASGVAKFV